MGWDGFWGGVPSSDWEWRNPSRALLWGSPSPGHTPVLEPAERKEASDATGAALFFLHPKCEGCTPKFAPFKIGDQDLRGE